MSSFKSVYQMTLIATVVACCAVSSAAAPYTGKATLQTKGVQWEKSLDAAHQKAVQSNKPILIVFEASWCRYCKKLKKETINHPKMSHYINQTFIPVQLDLDHDKRIAKILGVKKLPCTIILSPEADLLGKYVGFEKPVTYFDKIATARKLQDRVHQVKYVTPAR